MLQPLEVERNELGYHLAEVREGRYVRVVHRPCKESSVCVFFVHGGGGRAGHFKHLINGLESRVNIVAFDFLGHGDSPKPDQPDLYTADEHLEDLLRIYDKYKCSRNTLVGHCYGALHVLRLIKLLHTKGRMEEVASVALLSLGDQCIINPTQKYLSYLPAAVLEVLRPLARSASNAAIFTPMSDPSVIAFENGISIGNRMYMMKVILQDCSDQDLWDTWLSDASEILVSANTPRVLICGDDDGIFPLERCNGVKRALQISDECFHVVREAGHLPMIEKPNEVLQILKDMLF